MRSILAACCVFLRHWWAPDDAPSLIDIRDQHRQREMVEAERQQQADADSQARRAQGHGHR